MHVHPFIYCRIKEYVQNYDLTILNFDPLFHEEKNTIIWYNGASYLYCPC